MEKQTSENEIFCHYRVNITTADFFSEDFTLTVCCERGSWDCESKMRLYFFTRVCLR